MKTEDIDWDKHGKIFLETHGWVFDGEGYMHHEIMPLAEDISMGRFEEKCNELYPMMWKSYRAYIHGTVVLNQGEE